MANTAQQAAEQAGACLEPFARLGYAARGVADLIIGYLAVLAA